MLTTILLILHWALAITLMIRLMVKKRAIGETMAWLFVIFAMPVIGALAYYAFGERRQGDKRVRRLDTLSDAVERWQDDLTHAHPGPEHLDSHLHRPMARFVTQVTGFPVVQVRAWKLLGTYEEVFDQLISLIQQAKRQIHLEFYIWEVSGRVVTVHQELLEARKRGVQVRILVDSLGSDDFIKSEHRCTLIEAGCEFEESMKMHLLGGRWDLRNHRKIVVVDGKAAMAGSFNLADPNFFKQKSGVGKWVDAMVCVDCPGAQALNGVFLQDWLVEKDEGDRANEEWAVERWDEGDDYIGDDHKGPCPMQVLPSGPGTYSESIHQVLLMSIYSAQSEIILSTPYFVPGDAILQSLISASLRGVRVLLILPKKSDIRLANFAGASHYDDLLIAGIEVQRFEGGLLHTKSLTIDGKTSIFGTVNLDKRSFWLNSEVTMLMYGGEFTSELRALQLSYLDKSTPVVLEEWRQRKLWRKAIEAVTRLLGPVL